MQIAVKDSIQASSDKLHVILTLIDYAPKKKPSTVTENGEEELGDDASPGQASTSNLSEAVEPSKKEESGEEELDDDASTSQASTNNPSEAVKSGEEELDNDAFPGQSSTINLAELINLYGVEKF